MKLIRVPKQILMWMFCLHMRDTVAMWTKMDVAICDVRAMKYPCWEKGFDPYYSKTCKQAQTSFKQAAM